MNNVYYRFLYLINLVILCLILIINLLKMYILQRITTTLKVNIIYLI